MPRGGLQTSLVSMVNMLAAPFRRRTSTGPRRGASAGRGAPICRAPVGLTYRGARLADKTHGTLNAARSNIIVYPTSYGAQHPDPEWLIAPGKPVDPTKYFIIIVNKFAIGRHPRPATRRRSTAAVTRISRRPTMSGCSSGCWRRCSASSGSRWFTASRWGRSRRSIGRHCSPTGSSGIAPICGSAKTSADNFVFLEGVKAALTADPVWQDGWFATPPTAASRRWAGSMPAGG